MISLEELKVHLNKLKAKKKEEEESKKSDVGEVDVRVRTFKNGVFRIPSGMSDIEGDDVVAEDETKKAERNPLDALLESVPYMGTSARMAGNLQLQKAFKTLKLKDHSDVDKVAEVVAFDLSLISHFIDTYQKYGETPDIVNFKVKNYIEQMLKNDIKMALKSKTTDKGRVKELLKQIDTKLKKL